MCVDAVFPQMTTCFQPVLAWLVPAAILVLIPTRLPDNSNTSPLGHHFLNFSYFVPAMAAISTLVAAGAAFVAFKLFLSAREGVDKLK